MPHQKPLLSASATKLVCGICVHPISLGFGSSRGLMDLFWVSLSILPGATTGIAALGVTVLKSPPSSSRGINQQCLVQADKRSVQLAS